MEKFQHGNVSIIKEGWLKKKGQYIKNWRYRYYYLYSDGKLIGFSKNPTKKRKITCNNFHNLQFSEVTNTDNPNSYKFSVQYLIKTHTKIRNFCCLNAKDRGEWVKAIESL
ncbi:hypothetical protein HZS_8167 [Henneguya salminicola]|nr:hypothetical protein HZS_8167 [Henneguya salminicola]